MHIEKSSIGNFTDPAGACIHAAPTAPVLVYVDDSMLRECRTGINADGTVESASGDLVVFTDNTRIELSRATSGPAYGLWVQGFAAATMRNSVISINDVGIQFNNIAANGNPVLVLSQTQVIGANTGLNVASASAGGVPTIFIDGSPVPGGRRRHRLFTHRHWDHVRCAAEDHRLEVRANEQRRHHRVDRGGRGYQYGPSCARRLNFTGNIGISLTAAGTSGINLHLRDSTLSNATTLLKTSGTSSIGVNLIRSHLHNSTTAVDHGLGNIRMEQTSVIANQNSLVNNGSGHIISNGYNWIVDNPDSTGGTVYITPTIIPMK